MHHRKYKHRNCIYALIFHVKPQFSWLRFLALSLFRTTVHYTFSLWRVRNAYNTWELSTTTVEEEKKKLTVVERLFRCRSEGAYLTTPAGWLHVFALFYYCRLWVTIHQLPLFFFFPKNFFSFTTKFNIKLFLNNFFGFNNSFNKLNFKNLIG